MSGKKIIDGLKEAIEYAQKSKVMPMTDSYSAKAGEIAEEIMRDFHDNGKPYGGDKAFVEIFRSRVAQALDAAHLSGYERGKEEAAKVARKTGFHYADISFEIAERVIGAANATHRIELAIRSLPLPDKE